MKINLSTLGLALLILSGCDKIDQSPDWEVLNSGIVPDYHSLVYFDTSEYSEIRPFDPDSNGTNVIYEENQAIGYDGQNQSVDYSKIVIMEIPDSLNVFYFEDEEIFQNIKGGVSRYGGNIKGGWYRMHKGWVRGQKIAGEWVIDFDIYYGGKNNDKFRMKRGANY